MAYETLIVETAPEGADGVALIRLNRPEALNAFNDVLMNELTEALDRAEADDAVGAIVITGSDKAFAAGADIKAMAAKTYAEAYGEDFITKNWERASRCRKPVIAAVAGYALGGGCELAMMCDFIIAADNAKFGQPEVSIGVSPGAGGTQRLPRYVGKAKAMDLILTGRMMDAAEAERSGLVSRVVPLADLVPEALKAAARIAAQPPMVVRMTKEMIEAAFDTPLSAGLKLERRLFHSLFGLEDQREGMAAFVEKRKPVFKGR
ncbi:MAG: enoyl-CoA hydratase [Caulobacterales bacterium 68-7]|nr:enoyl-CoA hydratase [Caulobacterales bacterium]OJU11181.1 MAG: enoyl-CoA hydratase [Caulobacterales bacterium 68-7]